MMQIHTLAISVLQANQTQNTEHKIAHFKTGVCLSAKINLTFC